jgi:hypothetical protein
MVLEARATRDARRGREREVAAQDRKLKFMGELEAQMKENAQHRRVALMTSIEPSLILRCSTRSRTGRSTEQSRHALSSCRDIVDRTLEPFFLFCRAAERAWEDPRALPPCLSFHMQRMLCYTGQAGSGLRPRYKGLPPQTVRVSCVLVVRRPSF